VLNVISKIGWLSNSEPFPWYDDTPGRMVFDIHYGSLQVDRDIHECGFKFWHLLSGHSFRFPNVDIIVGVDVLAIDQ